MSDSILTRASRLLRSRRYADAIRLLEPEAVRYHDSFRYFYILALACLYSGDNGGALTYFRRAREIKMRDPGVLLGLAVLYLHRLESDRAIDLYLDILDKEPGNRDAARALEIVRKQGDPEKLAAWVESGKLKRLYPALPRVGPSAPGVALVSVGAFLAVAFAVFVAVRSGSLKSPLHEGKARDGISQSLLESADRRSPVALSGSFRYVLTRAQVLDSYDKAQRLFRDYRDDAARVELNRILQSNASEPVKAKARILNGYVATPGFDTIKDRFTYAQVSADPALYRDVHVVFRGLCANVVQAERGTSFELLVGYDTRSRLEGIVPVRFDFSTDVDSEKVIEVLGRVEWNGSSDPLKSLSLKGIAIHQEKRSLTDVGGAGQ